VSEHNLVVLLRLVEEGFNAGRFDRLDEIFSPEVVVHATVPVAPGIEGFRNALQAVRDGFPDGRVTIDDFAETGNTIYRRWTMRGTHTGVFFGIPPTHRSVEISGVDVERFEGGLIVEHWNFWDRAQMLEQLGLMPPPEAPDA
jgi:steroid delta-isomerase-like uncharacterized protein